MCEPITNRGNRVKRDTEKQQIGEEKRKQRTSKTKRNGKRIGERKKKKGRGKGEADIRGQKKEEIQNLGENAKDRKKKGRKEKSDREGGKRGGTKGSPQSQTGSSDTYRDIAYNGD